MFKNFLGELIDAFYSMLCLIKRYLQFYLVLIALAAFHAALPDALTQALFGRKEATEEILAQTIASGRINSDAFTIWVPYFIGLILFRMLYVLLNNEPPVSRFGKKLSSFLACRQRHTLLSLFCSYLFVNKAATLYSPLCFYDICCFILVWFVVRICSGILVKALKQDSVYFGYHSNDRKDITAVSEDTYQLLCTQYRALYEQSEKLDSNDEEYALCHAQLRAVRAVLTTLGFKEDDFERIESENNADKISSPVRTR